MEEAGLKRLYKIAYLLIGFVVTVPVGLMLLFLIASRKDGQPEYLQTHFIMLLKSLVVSFLAFFVALYWSEIVYIVGGFLLTFFGEFGVESDPAKNFLLFIFSIGGVGIFAFLVVSGSVMWLYVNIKKSLLLLADGKTADATAKIN